MFEFFRRKRNKADQQKAALADDFIRRTHTIYESYRAEDYRWTPEYDLEAMKSEDLTTLQKMIASGSIDPGNDDALDEQILATVRKVIFDLEEQRVAHTDFYTRQGDRSGVDTLDLQRLKEYWEEREEELAAELSQTKALYNKYHKYS